MPWPTWYIVADNLLHFAYKQTVCDDWQHTFGKNNAASRSKRSYLSITIDLTQLSVPLLVSPEIIHNYHPLWSPCNQSQRDCFPYLIANFRWLAGSRKVILPICNLRKAIHFHYVLLKSDPRWAGWLARIATGNMPIDNIYLLSMICPCEWNSPLLR